MPGLSNDFSLSRLLKNYLRCYRSVKNRLKSIIYRP
jgi:hypothetical protein